MAQAAINTPRRNLLRGMPASAPTPLRPPGALPELKFADCCTGCGLCLSACPTNIIIRGSGGYPEIDFRRGECTFCYQCVNECPESALNISTATPWRLRLQVQENCLAKRRVICQTCADTCDRAAIRFQPRAHQVATPDVDAEQCNGCGACIAACPENALQLLSARSPGDEEGVTVHA